MRPKLSRRAAIGTAAAAASFGLPASSIVLTPPLSPRLDAITLTPLSNLVGSVPGDLRYPSWMKGTWRVRNSLSKFGMPLGSAFVDGFTRATAQEDIDAAQAYQYTLSFVSAPSPPGEPDLCVAQDRRFNAVEETGAFLSTDGLIVTDGLYEVTPSAPHGRILLSVGDANARGDSRAAELTSTTGATSLFVPAVELGLEQQPTVLAATSTNSSTTIDLRIVWAIWEQKASKGAFVTSELAVQTTKLPADDWNPNESYETSIFEILTRFERPVKRKSGKNGQEVVRARNRLVQYLSLPKEDGSDEFYYASSPENVGDAESARAAKARETLARGRAVSFFDYDWIMERAPEEEGGEFGTPRLA